MTHAAQDSCVGVWSVRVKRVSPIVGACETSVKLTCVGVGI